MSVTSFLSMTKAAGYLGDLQSAQQLLMTLQSTLASDMPQVETAIQANDFVLLQNKLHQLKGFAPVFCTDALVAEILSTETLCKTTASNTDRQAALQASDNLLTKLKLLQVEVMAQLAKPLQV